MRPLRLRHDPSKSLVGFLIGDVSYAVPIATVREISRPLEVVALPHAPPAVIGVANYRGEVIPVVDMRARFGLSQVAQNPTSAPKAKWIIVAVEAGFVALAVDAVTDVFGTAGTELSPPPLLGGGEDRRGIAGVASYQGQMVFVLDAGRFNESAARVAALGGAEPSSPRLEKGA
jgi:purine-binding chemotaxis protein CheW